MMTALMSNPHNTGPDMPSSRNDDCKNAQTLRFPNWQKQPEQKQSEDDDDQ
jgi:hypothetical protein